jgi:UDP-2,3-diacylglucosamine hydrolase
MAVHFISDLHLQAEKPGITDIFLRFLGSDQARASEGLYVLGDLFESWIGDDISLAENREVVDAFAALSSAGMALYFMHGNRDFLVGEEFAAATGARILPDPTVINLFGQPTLLMHGDTLCTDDTAYQAFRAQVRDPENQRSFLALPPERRRQIAQGLRSTSQEAQGEKSMNIMDVNGQAVDAVLREHGVRRLIHGHTHRPDRHEWELDGARVQRFVMADWSEARGSVLVCDSGGCSPQPLT